MFVNESSAMVNGALFLSEWIHSSGKGVTQLKRMGLVIAMTADARQYESKI